MNESTYCTLESVRSDMPEIVQIRQSIHRHPELAYEEQETAALVADRLRAWGFEVVTGVGGTGVVGSLHAGTGTKSIGVRADMDALPIQEQTGKPYASEYPGKMHACGHDGHTAMLLGAAKYLGRTRNFNGTLRLYFQPAEEAGYDSGAQRMIEDGLFQRFPCDAVFGMHNHPGRPQGEFLLRKGAFMSAADKVTINVRGIGGHGARPHLAVDPIVVAASIVLILQTVVSRNVDPTQTAVVTVGTLHAGDAYNVIPEFAKLELTVRSFNPQVRQLLRHRIEELVQKQAESFGASVEIDYQLGYPVLVNSDAETSFAAEVARELVGGAQVNDAFDLVPASEDFAFMLQQRPGCFLRLGNGVGEGGCAVHNPGYDFNDENVPVGAAFWARLVERYLT